MIRKSILLLYLMSILCFSNAQDNTLVWKFANTGTKAFTAFMETDELGNSYLAGTFSSVDFQYSDLKVSGITGDQTTNTFILKVDPTGQPIWLHAIHGDIVGAEITPKAISVNERGELALIMTAKGTANVSIEDRTISISADSPEILPILLKISNQGFLSWSHPLQCTADTLPEIAANDLFIDEAGDVYATGYYRGESAELLGEVIGGLGDDDMLFVSCIRSDGNLGWFKNVPYDLGGDNGHLIGTLIEDSNSDFFYVAGTYEGTLAFYLGPDSIRFSSRIDPFIARFNNDGEVVWGKLIRGDSLDYPEKIRVLENNNLVLLGIYNSSSLYIDAAIYSSPDSYFSLFLAQYDENGVYVNSSSINARKPNHYNDNKNAFLNIDKYNNLYVSSEFYGFSIFSDENTLLNPEMGTSDVFVAKISSNTLDPYWTFHCSAPGDNYLEAISISSKGEIYLGGTSYNEYSIDNSPLPVSAVDGVPYIARIEPDGSLDYLYWQSNTADDIVKIQAIGSDSYGNSFVAGEFTGPLSEIDNINLDEASDIGIFLGKYSHTKPLGGNVVTLAGDIVNEGYVKIYGYSIRQRSPLNDSVDIQSDGSFEFADIPYGNYILTAIPTGSGLEDYIPSYYPASEYWEFAQQVTIDIESEESFFTIVMQEKSEFNGETIMTGNLLEEDGEKETYLKNFDKARPSKKSKVVLAGNKKQSKSTYEEIAYTLTNEEGDFAFYNIDDGSYYIWVDIPGLPCEPVHFVQFTGGQYISNLDYLVHEDFIEGTGHAIYSGISENTSDQGISIYPNPANESLTLSIDDFTRGIADLYDCNGSHLKHMILINGTCSIDLTSYESGSYFIRIRTEDSISFQKISIVH